MRLRARGRGVFGVWIGVGWVRDVSWLVKAAGGAGLTLRPPNRSPPMSIFCCWSVNEAMGRSISSHAAGKGCAGPQ